MEKKYQSEILMVLHQDAVGLHQLGIISDDEMRQWDEGCLVPEPTPKAGGVGKKAGWQSGFLPSLPRASGLLDPR
jgi:hypothetical protein